ncbi:hypothetical protein HAPAU_30350 [Halalkalicoccus paucihalophilus]|uniref:DUF4177 domain-containing protein n=1 Tax=Halalkalicoccus paucihalophilus TaxID=1008153 RepID=A0A151ABF8_9EURY|nr:DUF4177 domain-containing protein [Halalkalicoccus paucihalophilus]KYH24943.1 hypothetical protein HAPAU_30350 [Halalkalicoccus paucihalophilus]
MSTTMSEQRVSGEADYEYKVVNAPTSLLWFRIKRDATEELLNDLAADGWELDEAVVNWWGGAELFLRRSR